MLMEYIFIIIKEQPQQAALKGTLGEEERQEKQRKVVGKENGGF